MTTWSVENGTRLGMTSRRAVCRCTTDALPPDGSLEDDEVQRRVDPLLSIHDAMYRGRRPPLRSLSMHHPTKDARKNPRHGGKQACLHTLARVYITMYPKRSKRSLSSVASASLGTADGLY